MNKPTLLVLAAGLGSRYQGQKQIDTLGENKETLLEFALFDAIQNGLNKVVFIINDQFPEAYKKYLEEKLSEKGCKTYFVEQTKEKYLPEEYLHKLEGRAKPLGTGHAVYCAKEVIKEPFITINADDFYGKNTFSTSFSFVKEGNINADRYAMVAFKLKNTLSPNGTVSRGVCAVEDQLLQGVEEHTSIEKIGEQLKGKKDETGEEVNLDKETLVSMNFWVLDPSFFKFAERDFIEFLDKHETLANGVEFYLPAVVDKAIHQNEVSVRVLPTEEKWFGLTYHSDKEIAVREINDLKSKGVYPSQLWTE